MLATRKATTADVELLAGVIARAFEGDPVFEFIFPDSNHLERYKRFMAYEMRSHYMALGESYTTVEGVKGAALWAPPNKWKQSGLQTLRSVPTFLRTMSQNLPRVMRAMPAIEGAHPPGEHYYLSTLATDPVAQGTGVGSAVMAPVLAKCDEQGIGAYLESSKEANIPFYNRHGFEVTRELKLPQGGPSLWLMWREPRST